MLTFRGFFMVLYLINTIIFFNIKKYWVGEVFFLAFNALPYNSPLLDIWYFSWRSAAGDLGKEVRFWCVLISHSLSDSCTGDFSACAKWLLSAIHSLQGLCGGQLKGVSFSLPSGSIERHLRTMLTVGIYILSCSKDIQIAYNFVLFLIN